VAGNPNSSFRYSEFVPEFIEDLILNQDPKHGIRFAHTRKYLENLFGCLVVWLRGCLVSCWLVGGWACECVGWLVCLCKLF
jgi:hypothetical protein